MTRLRWRLRGAWLWPCFLGLTVLDGALLHRLPPYGEGPGTFVAALLVAGFLNLFVVAVLAPLAGGRLRHRRPDLPRLIADDYAGTALIVVVALGLVASGLGHRPAVVAERDDEAAATVGSRQYVAHSGAPQYRSRLAEVDLLRLEEDHYRTCVPGRDPRRWLCLFVNTDQRPAGVTRDPDEAPNSAYRLHGGFR